MGARSGGMDSLNSLLSDLGGVEGSILARPKTLGGMKKTQATPTAPSGAGVQSAGGSAVNVASVSASPSQSPWGSEGNLSSLPGASHSVDKLEELVRQRSPQTATAAPSQQTDTIIDDPLDWSFAAAAPTGTHTPQTTAPVVDDPFADFGAPPPTSAMSSEDPLSMFGGTPVPSKAPPPVVAFEPVVDSYDAFDSGFSDFSDTTHTNISDGGGGAGAGARAAIFETSPPEQPASQPSSQPSRAEEKTSGSNYTAFKEEGSGSFQETRVPATEATEPAPRKPTHRAFDYLDSYDNAGAAAAAAPAKQQQQTPARRPEIPPFSNGGGGPLAWSPSSGSADGGGGGQQSPSGSHQHQQHHTGKESVAEIGQKAAKVLQIGTKWFMNASKQIAKDVHAKIEHHRHAQQKPQQEREDHYDTTGNTFGGGAHKQPPRRGGGNHHHPSQSAQSHAIPAFYYDWASQLARMSPGSRAAALGAMDEGDRLEVQQIIDQAELGDAVLSSTSSGGLNSVEDYGAGTGGGGGVEEMPPPPAYEDVVNQSYNQPNSSYSAAEDSIAERQSREQQRAPSLLHKEAGDLLGGGGGGIQEEQPPAPEPKPAVVQRQPSIDLLGMDPDGTDGTTSASSAAKVVDTTSHIDAMFSVPPPGARPTGSMPPSRKPATASATTTAAAASISTRKPSSSSSSALDSMIDMQGDLPEVDTTGFSALYAEGTEDYNDAVEGEPEIRRVLRQRRIAEKHERMMRQLAEKRSREDAEDAEKAGKVAYREQLKPRIAAWTSGKKDNIRALLSTLHVVLWEDSGWTSPSIADLMEPSKVKRWYMKANLVVHPDKVKQKGGSIEQVATADVVFDVLKGAWGKFETSG